MKKLICLVTVIALAAVALIGCGKKEPYLGTYKYDHCTCSTTDTYLKLLVEEMAEAAWEDSNIYLEENGKAYYGIGCKDVEHTYIYDSGHIIFTSTNDIDFIYDNSTKCLILKSEEDDGTLSVFFKKTE